MLKLSPLKKLIAAFLIFITIMLICRFIYSDNIRYISLLWNLFLAWIPFEISILLTKKTPLTSWKAYLLLAGWLLFFPNALYIITDLVHLEESRTDAPVWFDAILLFTSSVTGLILAFASLYKVEVYLQKKIRNAIVNKIIVACLFVGSFGVYLGRFLRWNSWDIVTHPFSLFNEIITPIVMPWQYYKTWGVTVLLTCLFSLLYFTIKKLPGLLKEPGNKLYMK